MRPVVVLCLALLWQSPALAHEKKDARALSRFIMAHVYENQGEAGKAVAEYKAVTKSDPRNAFAHLGLASVYIKTNDIPAAVHELQRVAQLDPQAVEPHAILALLYSIQREPELADAEYERALENYSLQDPDNTDVVKALAALYIGKGRLDEASRLLKKALAQNPKDAESYFYLAVIADQRRDAVAVVADLKEAIRLKPAYDEALNYLGYYYVESGTHFEEARALIEQALAIAPDNGAYVDSLGWLMFRQGKVAQALPLLEKADALLDDPVISDHLGDAYCKAGNPRKAKTLWEKSLRLDPSQSNVKKKLDNL